MYCNLKVYQYIICVVLDMLYCNFLSINRIIILKTIARIPLVIFFIEKTLFIYIIYLSILIYASLNANRDGFFYRMTCSYKLNIYKVITNIHRGVISTGEFFYKKTCKIIIYNYK